MYPLLKARCIFHFIKNVGSDFSKSTHHLKENFQTQFCQQIVSCVFPISPQRWREQKSCRPHHFYFSLPYGLPFSRCFCGSSHVQNTHIRLFHLDKMQLFGIFVLGCGLCHSRLDIFLIVFRIQMQFLFLCSYATEPKACSFSCYAMSL